MSTQSGFAPIATWVAMLALAAFFASDFKSDYYRHHANSMNNQIDQSGKYK